MFRFTAFLPLVLGLVGCWSVGELEAQYAPTNESNLREAAARTMKAFRLEPVEARALERVDEFEDKRVPWGIQPDKQAAEKKPFAVSGVTGGSLVQMGSDELVQFNGHPCMVGDSCGCDRDMQYFFAKAKDGTIWILVPKPEENVHTVYKLGSCSYGCGVPSPPIPPLRYELPTKDINKIRAVEVSFELHVARESCTSPMPAP